MRIENRRCRRLLSSTPFWKSCTCCGSDLQEDASRGGEEGGEASLEMRRVCASAECDGFLCVVGHCLLLMMSECSADSCVIWQECAKSACACKKCDLRFCVRCSITPEPQVVVKLCL